MSEVNSQNLS